MNLPFEIIVWRENLDANLCGMAHPIVAGKVDTGDGKAHHVHFAARTGEPELISTAPIPGDVMLRMVSIVSTMRAEKLKAILEIPHGIEPSPAGAMMVRMFEDMRAPPRPHDTSLALAMVLAALLDEEPTKPRPKATGQSAADNPWLPWRAGDMDRGPSTPARRVEVRLRSGRTDTDDVSRFHWCRLPNPELPDEEAMNEIVAYRYVAA